MWELVLTNVSSFVLGLIVARWVIRRGLEKADDLTHDLTTATEETPVHLPSRERWVAGAVAIICGLILFGVGIRVGYETQQSKIDCFDTYANDLADSQQVRQDAAEERDVALYDTLRTTRDRLEGKRGDRAILRALDRYVAAYEDLEQARAANPYPDAPREVC
jgi:hypothetical protein